jgi:hypothetical protein
VGAAFLALGEALVDAVAVGLIGNNEDAAVGVGCRSRTASHILSSMS